MPSNGFYFSRLEVRGSTKETASLEFQHGLNVVSGASDTGKSYLLQCLDFMTGSSKPPKPITESAGYEALWLEIKTWNDDRLTLERSLRGGDFNLYRCGIDEVDTNTERDILKQTHRAGTSLSRFMLDLCGLIDVQIRTNAAGKTRTVSFRDVSHLTIISEERIYIEGSPVHGTGQVVNKTAEESLFKYLLTGVDDSSIVSEKTAVDSEIHRQARIDALKDIIDSTERELSEFALEPDEISTQLDRLRRRINEATSTITFDRRRLREEQDRRRTLWSEVERSKSRMQVLTRLVDRFELLERHYSSDLQRLQAMTEAGKYLSQLPQSDCPICGTEDPWEEGVDLDQIQRACSRESERIRLLQNDLQETTADIEREIEMLNSKIAGSTQRYRRISERIEQRLLPAEALMKEELMSYLDIQSRLERAATLADLLSRLRRQLDEAESKEQQPRKRQAPSDQGEAPKTSEADKFCRTVEELLTEWNFPDRGRVTFSESHQDIVINGKDRASHGKGIRALSYAAFVIGLLRYCREQERPYPGFIVLDSPLVAYREPDSMQDVESAGVKESLYRDLAKELEQMQIVIFENEDPPQDVIERIKYIHFSGDKAGEQRTGFFPVES